MTDPKSVSEWVTFAVTQLVTVLASPAFVGLLAILLFRGPIARVLSRINETGGSTTIGPIAISLPTPNELVQAEARAVEGAAIEEGDGGTRDLAERLESLETELETVQEALRRAALETPDLMTRRIVERAAFFANQLAPSGYGVPIIGPRFRIQVRLSNLGPEGMQSFLAIGNASLLLALVYAVREGDEEFVDAPYEAWVAAGPLLSDRGFEVDGEPLPRYVWQTVRSGQIIGFADISTEI